MKAMLWKEWRENAKWALLAGVALSLMMVYTLSQNVGDSYRYSDVLARLASLITFAAPLFAAALGLGQILTELRRDQWAFLIHRPATRSTIFAGKAVAGLSLYFLAMGLPVLGLALWLRAPGHVAAPFDWRLMLPFVADILMGAAFYFAGVLTALRPARWYGSRALGIATAVVGALANATMQEFWQSLLLCAGFALLLGVAAWGSFLTTGEYSRQPRVAKAALGGTMFLGGAAAVLASLGFLLGIATQLFGHETPHPYPYTRYIIDRNGRILRESYVGGDLQRTTDLQNRVASNNESRKGDLYPIQLMTFGKSYRGGYRETRRYFLPFDAEYNSKLNWFYDRSQDQIVGYSQRDKTLAGYLGPQGFLPANAPNPPRFAEQLQTPFGWQRLQILRFPHSVYRVYLGSLSVVKMDSTASNERVRGVCEFSNAEAPNASRIAVATENQVRFFTAGGQLLASTPLEVPPGQDAQVSVAILNTPRKMRYFLHYESINFKVRGTPTVSSHITETAANGQVLARYNLPPDVRPRPETRWWEVWPSIAAPPILVAGFVAYAGLGSRLGVPGAAGIWREIARDPATWVAIAAFSVVAALVCAGLTLLMARRCAWPKSVAWKWALGVFALGPFGLLMLGCLREWPARVVCPSCGLKRVVGREKCEHCGASFPQAAPDGTEIFADAPLEHAAPMRLAS